MSNSQKNFMSIRSKLLAAVAMLLVASFMVVSSTYAWFTLSTAPEVTGITTQIGANGNLEIALNTTNDLPQNTTGTANPSTVDKNKTWGNIIDLGDTSYGLSNIVLKPSLLAVTANGTVDDTPLYTPSYGADGRVESISKNGFYGTWNGTGFALQGTTGGYGVRALGTVASMTAQQLQYKNAASAVKTSLELFNNHANLSLVENGGALVTLILAGVTSKDPKFTVAEIAAVDALLDELEEGLPELENAIKNFLILVVANTQYNETDAKFDLIMDAFNANWTAIFNQLKDTTPAGFATTMSISIPAYGEQQALTVSVPDTYTDEAALFASVAQKYDTIAGQISDARGKYDDAAAGTEVSWADFQGILTSLMKVDTLSINGKGYNELLTMKNENKMSELVDWGLDVLVAGVQVTMPKDSGVYADIASVSKNISANFRTSVEVNFNNTPIDRDNVSVTMLTDLQPSEITALNPSVIDPPAEKTGTDANAVITDTYAYVLDFVFRTNAEGSNLKLQQKPTDRIYAENTASSTTMGSGSFMEFSTQAGFGVDQVKGLMDNIRLVFVDTDTGEILVGGYLDTANATSGATVKAEVKLQAVSVTTTEVGGVSVSNLTWGERLADDEQNIVALSQNEAKYISVYVYLDGTTTDNADVAATTTLSTSGKLNLQFASDADLKPMDYADLKNPSETTAPANPNP